MASGAGRLLDQAGLFPDVPAAIADCDYVYATTARGRELVKPVVTPERAYVGAGDDFLGRPAGWGDAQREAWGRAHYHQPSDEWRDEYDLSGMVEDARLLFLLGLLLLRRRLDERDRLMAIAWIEDAHGRVLQLASDVCPDPRPGRLSLR